MWSLIHQKVANAARLIAEVGKYDDAIFAAFRVVEAEIQETIGSGSIGQALISEAFTASSGTLPKIDLSPDTRDREGVANLFSGALSYIRNDRGHKKAPFVPCNSIEACMLYLQFASFLLYLLEKDRTRFPKVQSLRLFGSADHPRAEFSGRNFHGDSRVVSGGLSLHVLAQTPTSLEVELPADFQGALRVEGPHGSSDGVTCDARSLGEQASNYYEIVAADVPIYEDEQCSLRRSDWVGLLVRANESGMDFLRIMPVRPGTYRSGFYVTHGPFDFVSDPVGKSWFRSLSGEVSLAWNAAAPTVPEILCPSGNLVLSRIEIMPSVICTEKEERRTLRVIGKGMDGLIRQEVDLTEKRIAWKSNDESIAAVVGGIVFPKKFGEVQIACEFEGLRSLASVKICSQRPGDRAVYFQGIRRLQQLRIDNAGSLYFCNQSNSVYRLSAAGKFEEAIRLRGSEFSGYGIDCLALGNDDSLFVNSTSEPGCYKFRPDGTNFAMVSRIGTCVEGTKKSMAVDGEGNVFIAVMSGESGAVIQVRPDGTESYFSTRDSVIYLGLGPEGTIYVPSLKYRAVDVYTKDGSLLRSISYSLITDTPGDMLVDASGNIYLAMFHSGQLLKIAGSDSRESIVAGGFTNPCGIAMDAKGDLYVANFGGDSIEKLYL